MDYASEGLIGAEARRARRAQFSIWLVLATPAVALLIQVYLPLFQTLQFFERIELPLLVTIYFGLMLRSQIRGLLLGMAMGITQDCFTGMLGMNGICKTLVGYLAASIGMQFDVENGIVRLALCSIFYLFHQFLYWVMQRSLLGKAVSFDIMTELMWTAINAFLGVLLFFLLDRFRQRE